MYYNFTVNRPENSRTTKGENGTVFVQMTLEKRYDKEKRFNNDKRIRIGKMVDGSEILMYPNEQYFEFFPQETRLEEAPNKSDVLKVGNYAVFSKIFTTNGLGDLLDEVYEEKSQLIKDVASYMVVEESSVMQHYESYTFDHPTFSKHAYSDSSISEMFRTISVSKHDLLLEKWNRQHANREGIYISYDSTNMNSAATGAQLLEYGKSKDANSDLPQVNVSIGFDMNDATPLFYEVYPGSVIDNTQCKKMVEHCNYYGYRNIGFIIDRGYFSMHNIHFFEANGYSYIIMAKINAGFIQRAYKEVQMKLRLNGDSYLEKHNVNGMSVEGYLTNDEEKTKKYIHIYYDDIRAANERLRLQKRFSQFDHILEEMVAKKVTQKHETSKFEKYYHMTFVSDYLTDFKRKTSVIKEALDDCGYFCIITSEQMDANKALTLYRHRDTSEKLFMIDKTFLESDTMRVYSDEAIETKQMANFIALVLRNDIYTKMKDTTNTHKTLNVPEVLRELDKIIITKNSSNKYKLRYALTATQKLILEQYNITEKDLISIADEITKKLSA